MKCLLIAFLTFFRLKFLLLFFKWSLVVKRRVVTDTRVHGTSRVSFLVVRSHGGIGLVGDGFVGRNCGIRIVFSIQSPLNPSTWLQQSTANPISESIRQIYLSASILSCLLILKINHSTRLSSQIRYPLRVFSQKIWNLSTRTNQAALGNP